MDSLHEALHAETSGIPPLGDIDRAIHDVSVARRRWAGLAGVAAAALVLVVALVGPGWQPVSMEPAVPQPYPTTAPQSGAVFGWGSNENGQTTVPGAARSGVTAIAVGDSHALALKDGRVIAWGYNLLGVATVPVEAQSGVTAIAAGGFHSLALKDGRVIAWGNNGDGQVTVPVEAQSGVTAIAAGLHHSLAVKDGRVIVWGRHLLAPGAAQSGVTAVAAGASHSLALKDGRVIAWGLPGETGSDIVPEAAQSGVTAISAALHHSLALKDGRVIAWGYSGSRKATVPIEAQSGVTAIAAGASHSLALKDGRVIAWGNNDSGQATVPVEVQSGVTSIAAGTVSLAVGPVSRTVLAADPLLTDADWSQLTGGSQSQLVVRTNDEPRRLSPCLTDPRRLGTPVTHAAAYIMPNASGPHPPGRMINEFVLLYGDEAGATRAVADIRAQIDECAEPMNEETADFSTVIDLSASPIEEGFDAGGDADGVHHHVRVARHGNVVFVVESTGWADQPTLNMTLAMVRAIPDVLERYPSLLRDSGLPGYTVEDDAEAQ